MDREKLAAALGVVLGVPTLLQITPIKINPWSWFWKLLKHLWFAFCRSLNAPVLAAVEARKTEQQEALASIRKDLLETKKALDAHIAVDDEREADKVRASILHFNNELMREIPHTEEEYVEILTKIDWYHDYCRTHEDYKNSRAVHAIANIERVYDVRLEKHDFL
jgi:hypothetical protein